MRIEIINRISIDTETGVIKSHATWRIEGQDKTLGPAMTQVVNQLREKADQMTAAAADDPPPPGERPIGSPPARAQHLAGLVRVSVDDLTEAIRTRPMGRILEVLEWMKEKMKTTKIQLPSRLFWTLVNKD
jgi:hypothetical protein